MRARLDAGDPYVVRFRSPGIGGARVSFTDVIRGEISSDDNRNDMVILKRSDQRAAAAHLPFRARRRRPPDGVTLVIRGEEWISSVPLHHQLFDALGFPRLRYAHVAPLMKQDGGSRRKLSKRKDPEASVGYYIEQGFPAEAVLYYLRGLANGRLAELPLPRGARRAAAAGRSSASPGRCSTWSSWTTSAPTSSPRCRARRSSTGCCPGPTRTTRTSRRWSAPSGTWRCGRCAVERVDTENPRKDLRKWADFRGVYGFFFPEIFELVTDPADERFGGLAPDLVRAMASGFAAGYVEPGPDVAWFEQIRILAGVARLRAAAEGLQEEPGRLPRLDRRRRRGHPGADHRLAPVARTSSRSPPRSAATRCCAGSRALG